MSKTSMFYKDLTDVCHDLLKKEDRMLKYLEKRKIDSKIINKYKIGYFPEDLRLLYGHIDPKKLLDNNVIWNSNNSPFKMYPLVIPIKDLHGHEIAIGCRTVMSESQRKKMGIPKYRNSVYNKTLHLFGLDNVVDKIRKSDKVYVAEGYFDVISAQSNGIENTVGTCGTMLSTRQIITLSRYTKNIDIIFDNDEAGQNAANRVVDKYKDKDLNIKITRIPPEFKDLDEYIRKTGLEII